MNDAIFRKENWLIANLRKLGRQSGNQIDRWDTLARDPFYRWHYYLNRPAVIVGMLADWPALTRWTPRYLIETVGNAMVDIQSNRTDSADFERAKDRHTKQMRFAEFVEQVETATYSNDFYMTAYNGSRNIEALAPLYHDITTLSFCKDEPGNPGFIWYGPRGTMTPLHHDLTNNFMAQVKGDKRVWLVSPFELPHVYNDHFCFSQVDLAHLDLERFPLMRDVPIYEVLLHPGDLLFLPVGWWHQVEALDTSITLTFTNFIPDNDFASSYPY